ncbi:hypothetical protein Pelo_18687 [Pelomyxa schiedti]|nr:hypothetical protein Pelo_18687 [Pelomyxa schiedti]
MPRSNKVEPEQNTPATSLRVNDSENLACLPLRTDEDENGEARGARLVLPKPPEHQVSLNIDHQQHDGHGETIRRGLKGDLRSQRGLSS